MSTRYLNCISFLALTACFTNPQSAPIPDPEIPKKPIVSGVTNNHGHTFTDMTVDDINLLRVETYYLDGPNDIETPPYHQHSYNPTIQQMLTLQAGNPVQFFVIHPADLHTHSFNLRKPN